MSFAWALAAALAGVVSARAARAQESAAIRAAIRLAAEGRGDSARQIVARELSRSRPGDPAYVEALFWRARLAASGDSARRDFRRVAIEYSTSRWADEALLQLAQLAMASGNAAEALRDADRVRSDYPGSPLRARAALWAGRASFEIGDPATACAMLDSARAEASDDVEFLNQVSYYRSRCPAALAALRARAPGGDTTAAPGDTTGRRGAPAAGQPVPKDTAGGVSAPARPAQYEVQITATRSSRTARAMLARARRTGAPAKIVTGSDGLLRVRAGPYASEKEATAAAARLRRALGTHPIVVKAP